jgi:hypothetical protein
VDPHHETSLRYLQTAYERTGRFEDAIGIASRRVIATPALLEALRKGVRTNGPNGYWAASYEITRQARMPEDVRARRLALLSARLGRKGEMLHWLEECVNLRDTYAVMLNTDQTLAPYREDPGFRRLVQRVGLPSSSR